jgi:hypothetical protein
MYHQTSAPAVAAEFLTDLQEFARQLDANVPRTDKEADFLQDVARGRYEMKALQRLIDIARRSERPEQREFLAELVRRQTIAGSGHAISIAAVFDEETAATGETDNAQRRFERAPDCPSTWHLVREKLTRQLVTTRAALDAVLAHRV